MQATTTPKLANGHPALQAGLAAVLIATAIAVGATIGIGLAQGAIAPVAGPAAGDYEASGVRRTAPSSEAHDRALDGAAFRNPTDILTKEDFLDQVGFRRSAAAAPGTIPVVRGPLVGGYLLWTGTQPGTSGKVADDQMSSFNNLGRSEAAGDAEKVGRAHR